MPYKITTYCDWLQLYNYHRHRYLYFCLRNSKAVHVLMFCLHAIIWNIVRAFHQELSIVVCGQVFYTFIFESSFAHFDTKQNYKKSPVYKYLGFGGWLWKVYILLLYWECCWMVIIASSQQPFSSYPIRSQSGHRSPSPSGKGCCPLSSCCCPQPHHCHPTFSSTSFGL